MKIQELPPKLASMIRTRRQSASNPFGSHERFSDAFTMTAAEIAQVVDRYAESNEDICEIVAAYLSVEREKGASAATKDADRTMRQRVRMRLDKALTAADAAARESLKDE